MNPAQNRTRNIETFSMYSLNINYPTNNDDVNFSPWLNEKRRIRGIAEHITNLIDNPNYDYNLFGIKYSRSESGLQCYFEYNGRVLDKGSKNLDAAIGTQINEYETEVKISVDIINAVPIDTNSKIIMRAIFINEINEKINSEHPDDKFKHMHPLITLIYFERFLYLSGFLLTDKNWQTIWTSYSIIAQKIWKEEFSQTKYCSKCIVMKKRGEEQCIDDEQRKELCRIFERELLKVVLDFTKILPLTCTKYCNRIPAVPANPGIGA